MTKYISLFGATTTDTQVQVVKENQVIIGIGAGASRKRYVVYKVEHTARGYVYHMVDTETKEISQTDILRFRGGFAREAGGRASHGAGHRRRQRESRA